MTGAKNADQQPPKSRPDWQAIEADYRTGRHSNRTLATKYSVSDFAIRDRAKRFAWQKDLTLQVAAEARAIADHRTQSQKTSRDVPPSEAEIIRGAATDTAEVILQHRDDLAELRDIEAKLLKALKLQPITADSLPTAARVHRSLTLARVQRISLERAAWNIATASPSGGPSLDHLTDAQLAALEDILVGP